MGRRLFMAALIVAALARLASPAAASHDDFHAGAVVLHDRSGAADVVMVAFPLDTPERDAIARVEEAAAAAGVALSGLDAVENTDPDTVRVRAQTLVGERAGFLARRIPAEAIAAWAPVAVDGQLYVDLGRWATAHGLNDAERRSGAYRIDEPRDVSYRVSVWALLLPLLIVAAAALVPFAALRGISAAAVRRGGSDAEQLHRIRIASVATQIVAPLALVAVLVATGVAGWVPLVLGEFLPSVAFPEVVLSIAGLLGVLVPYLVAVVATVLAVMPYERRLRSTQQSNRSGVSLAVRFLLVVLAPLLLWIVVLGVLPQVGTWVFAPVFLVLIAAAQPLILNTVMGARPLEDDLRRRVLALCRDHGLRVRDARLLDSRGGKIANAAISGIVPQLRYVYLTDHAVKILDDDELDAILAHEIGHGRGHHLLIKLVAGLAALGALVGLFVAGGDSVLSGLVDAIGVVGLALMWPLLIILVLLLVHGVLGVALEQRADDYAARHVGTETLIRALDKVADANTLKRRTGWLWNLLQQHPGMEQRIELLRRHSRHSETAPRA